MRDLAHVEVAVRNAYDHIMRQHWRGTPHRLLDLASPLQAPLWRTRPGRGADLNSRNRASVSDAVARCGGASAKPDAGIAELSLGFCGTAQTPRTSRRSGCPTCTAPSRGRPTGRFSPATALPTTSPCVMPDQAVT